MFRMTIATLTLIGLLAATAHAHNDAARQATITVHSPRWIPPLIRRLAVCESRGNPRHHVFNGEGEFGGIVSWYVGGGGGTWALDKFAGMPRYPWQATLRQQVRVAVRSVQRGRTFGCLNHGWVRG